MVKAFAFAAGEFLDEEMEELQEAYGRELDFFTKGKYVKNEDNGNHPYEWWAPQEAIDSLNLLIKQDKNK